VEHRSNNAQLLVIADDLTGANDAGVQFAKRGIRSIVVAEPHFREYPRGYPIVVVNTESRHTTPVQAAALVRKVAEAGLQNGVTHIFKKTDSTLRGNIGAELRALKEATGAPRIPFVPAFPELGRTTREGIHYVDGAPIASTAFANDPLSPVRESEIAKVLKQTAELHVASAKLATYLDYTSADCIVIDCDSREELRVIARFFQNRSELRVLSGSAAFAEELPDLLQLSVSGLVNIQARAPILFVNGSLNPRAFQQVAAVRGEMQTICLTPENLFRQESDTVFDGIAASANVLLCTLQDRAHYPAFELRSREMGISDLHHAVAQCVGQLVRELLTKRAFGTLVVFGGDTLMGIAKAMKWKAFIPQMEIEAGISVAKPLGSDLVVVSKAGGFGDGGAAKRILTWVGK
jgi:D-threonate/D-erythronate kinase